MSLASLNLWADEQRRIHQCLIESLQQLIIKQTVTLTDEEKAITGKFRPILRRTRKFIGLTNWSLQFEASSFESEEDPDPFAHPDIRFTTLDIEGDQYDYDIECKLVRIKRVDAKTDYCYHYVKEGVLRYQLNKYAQSLPPMGTILGYVQEGETLALLKTINQKAKYQRLDELILNGVVTDRGISHLTQRLKRGNDQGFTLHHLWADFR